MSKNIIFLFFLLSIIEISKLQEVDKDMMRAVACLSLIRRLDDKSVDQRVLSTYMLSCFVQIDDSTAQKLIMSQTSNRLDISEEQIKKLTNMHEIEKKYTEDQIMDYSNALNKALEKLKNAGPGAMRSSQKGSRGNSNSNKNRENANSLLGNMISVLLGLFSTNDSLLLLIGLFVGLYLILKQVRKCCTNNEKNKSGNNSKSKVKKRRKTE